MHPSLIVFFNTDDRKVYHIYMHERISDCAKSPTAISITYDFNNTPGRVLPTRCFVTAGLLIACRSTGSILI